jgi:hypothetical protein
MKKTLLSLSVLAIYGCYRNAKIVEKFGIRSIEVSIAYNRSLENSLTRFNVTDTDSNGKIINITCNGPALMDNNGHTYQLQRTIETILGNPSGQDL